MEEHCVSGAGNLCVHLLRFSSLLRAGPFLMVFMVLFLDIYASLEQPVSIAWVLRIFIEKCINIYKLISLDKPLNIS